MQLQLVSVFIIPLFCNCQACKCDEIAFLDYYFQLQINSRMIKQQNYDDRTIKFVVNIQNKSPAYLLLNIKDYQRQFRQFVSHNQLTKAQAIQLKFHIQNTLKQQLREIKQIKQSPQQDHQRSYNNLEHPRNGRQKQNIGGAQRVYTKQYGTQIEQFHSAQPRIEDSLKQKDSIKFDFQVNQESQQNISFGESSIRKEGKNQINYLQIEKVIQKSLQLQQSAKFHEQFAPHQKLQISSSDFGEDQNPKPYPFRSQPKLQDFQNTSKHSQKNQNKYSTKLRTGSESHQKLEQKQNKQDKSLEKVVKKKLFLEDMRNPQQKDSYKEIIGNPSVFKRLYEVQTQSFKNKQMQQRNCKQEFEYYELQDYMLQKPSPKIQGFQNLSKKTTESFEAKLKPESNWFEEKEKVEFQKSFKQHLKEKQKEKQMRKKRIKEQSGQKNLSLKGSHCESKQMIKKLKKMEEEKQQKEKIIKQRMRLSPTKDLSKKSFSPASKSRQCAVCSPKEQKRKGNQKASIVNIKNMERNKKYVSHVLSQSYKEFLCDIQRYK